MKLRPGLRRRLFLVGLVACAVSRSRAEGRRYRIALANRDETPGVTLEGLGFTGTELRRSFELAGRTLPIDTLYFDNASDSTRAVANAEAAIAARVDLLIEYNGDADANAEIARRLAAASIPALALVHPLPGAPLYGPDNRVAGRIAGRALAAFAVEAWPGEQVFGVLIGDLADPGPAISDRVQGITEGVHEALPSLNLAPLDTGGQSVRADALLAKFLQTQRGQRVLIATLDDLATGNGLVIRAELQIPIAFALLARPGTGLGDIKRIGGHPQSMPQCRGWLAANLPDSEWVPLASNAEAARQAADGQVDAALAGAFAAGRYGLAVIAPDVHDRASAVTRFVVVSPPGPLPARTGADRTSVAAFLAEDHPGALLEILTEFAVRGINLTKIQSRPTGDRLGQYYFFVDCEGHVDDARVGEALMGLRRVCREVRFLGSYARCDGGATHVRPGTSDAEFAEAAAWLGRLRFGRP